MGGFSSSLRPADMLDRYSTVWTARESASLRTTPTNPNNPAILPPLFNLLSPLSNSARAIQISQYEAQKESGYEWLFNYKAVLNTKVTTITTKLTNALNADLESIYSVFPGGRRYFTNPNSGITVLEPAPAADKWAYLYGADPVRWNDPATGGAGVWGPSVSDWDLDQNGAANSARTPMVINAGSRSSGSGNSRTGPFITTGTKVIQSGGTISSASTGTIRFHDGVTDGSTRSSKFWQTYTELFNNAEFTDVWRYGLLDKAVITGSAATGNGSQLQASITLRDPDVMKMKSGTTNLAPGSPYPGQTNLTPGVTNLVPTLPGGGSSTNNEAAYNENYVGSGGTRVTTDMSHGFIQNKFTAFWHS